MDAKDHPVISVLGDQRRFVVPIYQRHYSWGKPASALSGTTWLPRPRKRSRASHGSVTTWAR